VAVQLSRRAKKDLRRIGPGTDLNGIQRKLSEIGEAVDSGELPPSTKPLKSILSTRRGDYRILWTVYAGEVVIVRVIHRSDLDRVARTL